MSCKRRWRTERVDTKVSARDADAVVFVSRKHGTEWPGELLASVSPDSMCYFDTFPSFLACGLLTFRSVDSLSSFLSLSLSLSLFVCVHLCRCGHCKQLAPNYAKAASELKGTAVLGAVDCTVEKDLCSEYGVQGFPTLKVFRSSTEKPSEYTGGRSSEDIVKYMKKQNEPAYHILTTPEEVDIFVEKDGVDVIGIFTDPNSGSAKAFIAAADSLRNDYNFALVSDPTIAVKVVPGAADEQVVVVKSATDSATHTGPLDTESIVTFVNTEAFPLVGEIGPENFQKYLDRGLNLVWFFIDPKSDKTADLMSAAEQVASEFKGKVSAVKLDGVRWAEHAKHFGIPAGQLPGIVAEDREQQKNYVFSGEPTAEALRAHFQGFVDKTLQPTIKSQEIPEDNSAPVKVVVGKNFEEIVINNDKDVFVEFYAPWCGHCKTLAPKYDELGKKFAGNEKVVIAKVDATENDTPAKISGFPTLILYPGGDKTNPINYDGERNTQAMYDWILEHGTNAAEGASATETDSAHSDL